MAWDYFDWNGVKIVSGDKPVDETALALKKIAQAYEDAYQRKPTVAEIFYALQVVILANPSAYISDKEPPVRDDFFIGNSNTVTKK